MSEVINTMNQEITNFQLARFAKAFQLWEEAFRAEPEKFMTAEETASAEVSQLSADSAAYFVALLAQVDNDQASV